MNQETPLSGFTKAEIEHFRDAFALFDTTNRGYVIVEEMRDVVHELCLEERTNRNSSLFQMRAALKNLEGDQQLSFEDFVTVVSNRNNQDKRDDIEKTFDLFDEDQKGYIDINDLKRVAEELGESMTQQELEEMIQRATENGKVNRDEFRSIMTRKLFSEI